MNPQNRAQLTQVIMMATIAIAVGALIVFIGAYAFGAPVATSTVPMRPSGEGTMSSLVLWLNQVALPAAVAFIGAAATAGIRYWQSKGKNETEMRIAMRLKDSAMSAVKAIQQTYVDQLTLAQRPESQGGTDVTPDEAAKARAMAIATAKSYWSMKGLKEVMKVFGLEDVNALDALFGNHVEAAVQDLKLTKTAVGRGSIPPARPSLEALPPVPP